MPARGPDLSHPNSGGPDRNILRTFLKKSLNFRGHYVWHPWPKSFYLNLKQKTEILFLKLIFKMFLVFSHSLVKRWQSFDRLEFSSEKSQLGAGKKRTIQFTMGEGASISSKEIVVAKKMLGSEIQVTVGAGLPNTSSKLYSVQGF